MSSPIFWGFSMFIRDECRREIIAHCVVSYFVGALKSSCMALRKGYAVSSLHLAHIDRPWHFGSYQFGILWTVLEPALDVHQPSSLRRQGIPQILPFTGTLSPTLFPGKPTLFQNCGSTLTWSEPSFWQHKTSDTNCTIQWWSTFPALKTLEMFVMHGKHCRIRDRFLKGRLVSQGKRPK